MADGFVKALSFILFIVIGILLKRKFTSNDEVNGLKKIILLLALPSTIFIALLKIKIDFNLFLLPLIALGFNVFLYLVTPIILVVLGITEKSQINTAKLLIPSLAPGLSCFPFILEFLGEDYLAKAAMADLGNKFFVLFILYLIAIKWYYNNQSISKKPIETRITSLGKTMLFEPVNLFIITALVLVFFGMKLNNLPTFAQEILNRLSYIMTPLVLIFIGLSVKIKTKQFSKIFSMLMLRASLTILVITTIATVFKLGIKNDILFYIVFALSACSFWPFAHICNVAEKEAHAVKNKTTFNMDFALAILAISLPISVIIILTILSARDTFADTNNLLLLGVLLFFLGILIPLYEWSKKGAQIKDRFKNAK